MGENFLSLLHIQKLGHPIEEIRLRALSSVVSKYNLNLVDERNLENTKLLLEKLLDWFDYEKCLYEGKVLNLLCKILKSQNADLFLKEIDRKNLLKRVKKIEKQIGSEHQSLIQDIIKCITSVQDETDTDCFNHLNCAFIEPERVNGGFPDIYEFQRESYSGSSRGTKSTEDYTQAHVGEVVISERDIRQKPTFRIEFFPWQHLTPGDKQVLSSVYDGLRYIDNKNSVLKSCQFFNEVLLRDFPTEVFVQRPSIIKTFLQLIEYSEEDVRIPVVKCLIKTIQCLKETLRLTLNTALFNTKKEFYTTSVFPNGSDETCGNFQLNVISFDEDLNFDDNDCIDPNLKKYQLSVPQFCFEILLQSLPHLGRKCTQEEINCLLNLTQETLTCLLFNLNSSIWTEKDIRNRFYKVFVKLYEVLKFQKGRNPIVHVILLYFITTLLNSLKPPSGVELSEMLVSGLQTELGSCISDFVLVLLFPQLHSEIYKFVKQLLGQKEKDAIQDHDEVLLVLDSMKSSVKLSRSQGKMRRMEKLECVHAAIPSLDFHQNFALVQFFVDSCLLKWRKCQLSEDELKMRDKILIKLLAHCNDFVKTCAYREIHGHAVKLLGVDEAKTPRFEFPADKMDFLFRTDILTEIICHGLNSPIEKVRKYSSEIISNLLKSRFVMSDICWSDFVQTLIPCLSLLQCYADKSTNLGRCIVKMFDPDVAKSNVLPPLELLKGNMRFLFSKNSLTRDEALSRLFWLLGKEDKDSKKLPRMIVLTGLNLSGICSCVEPQEYAKIRQVFYSPDRLCDVLDMLNSENVEPKLKRSALSQIAVMVEDTHLHQTFLEQKGLEKVLEILDNCLIEKEYQNYPDSVKPIVDILKALAFQNACVRQELSCQIDVMYNILRGLFLFSSDNALRQNAVELICLLLYNDCILRVPSDLSIKCTISLPDLVVNRMCLPFLTHIHWRNSRHFEPSVKNTLMSKENCSKLIRTFWAIQWVGSLSDIMGTQPCDLPEKTSSPGLPDDMKVSAEDIKCLKDCSFGTSVKQTLYNIQNATTHDAVFSSLDKLQSYFLLYNVDKGINGKKSSDVGSDTTLSHMLWESTLERFVTAQPSCDEDERLLLQVIRLVQLLLRSFKSERLTDWVGRLLIDEHQPLIVLLRNIGNENFGLVGKELRLAIIELTQQIVTLRPTLDRSKWFLYLELISDHLQLDKKNEFYNVAYVDWFLSLLADLTGNWSWNFAENTKYLDKLIVRVMEIIIAFHCTKDSAVSFMGINIVRNSILVFNYVLYNSQASVKGWEKLWFKSLSRVVGQERNANYCWMLSLWFTRDPVTRAAAYALFVGFSATSLACDLLIDQLKIQFEHVWSQTFRVLFDENECSFVREKAAYLLSNLTGQGTKASCGSFLQHLQNINFYQEVYKILSNFDCEPKLTALWLHDTLNCFSGQAVSTPSFITTICILLRSVMKLSHREVSEKLLEFEIIGGLMNVLGEIPESARVCGKHLNSTEVLGMYSNVCKVLTNCVLSSCVVQSFVVQSQQCTNYLFSMINYNLFCEESEAIRRLKNELWTDVFDLFSALLAERSNCNKHQRKSTAFILINKCLTDNGIDHFISSLYLAVTSEDLKLRSAVSKFLINLFHHELITPKHITISDVFERKIASRALDLAKTHCWKALNISESLTLGFGIRIADVLTQIFLLSVSCTVQACKTTISDCLGGLLAVCKSAQNYCLERGLADSLILNLKQICVKLNLETVESLKKSSTKKKINPLLSDSETLFRLICNLVLGNGKAKSVVADCALSTVMFKLWPWCMTKPSLHVVALKMLCTFTNSCDQACRTLVLSGSLSKLGLKKSPGSVTLIHSVMNQVPLEMDLISNSHDSQILSLCLQLLTNCCRVTESRSVISKANFMQCFIKLHPNRKKRPYSDSVVESWLKYFIALSSHQDGQLVLIKNQEFLDLLRIKCTSAKSSHRLDALRIYRNLCFHQLNKVQLLGCCEFLSLLFETLDSKIGEEVQTIAVMIWSLTCNSQKAKLIMRSAGFESKLTATKRRFVMGGDAATADLIDTVVGILKNK